MLVVKARIRETAGATAVMYQGEQFFPSALVPTQPDKHIARVVRGSVVCNQ
ncbi:MAG: hypothetical protein PVJ83_09565 [Gammaproteobacteria bacterium]|jgi:hypothetical protein